MLTTNAGVGAPLPRLRSSTPPDGIGTPATPSVVLTVRQIHAAVGKRLHQMQPHQSGLTAALIAPTVLVDSAGIITNGPNKPCSDAGIVTFTTPPELAARAADRTKASATPCRRSQAQTH